MRGRVNGIAIVWYVEHAELIATSCLNLPGPGLGRSWRYESSHAQQTRGCDVSAVLLCRLNCCVGKRVSKRVLLSSLYALVVNVDCYVVPKRPSVR